MTRTLQTSDGEQESARLTTRGGAFRDLGDLNLAEACALDAVDANPKNYRPLNLLGAICYEREDFASGDSYFAQAQRLGAPPRMLDTELQRVVRKSDPELRQKAVLHLLQTYPGRFGWVERHPDASKG